MVAQLTAMLWLIAAAGTIRNAIAERSSSSFVSRYATAYRSRPGCTTMAPSGFTAKMDEKNHHLHKPVFIGEVKSDGQFNVVWKTPGPVKAQPWSPFIAGNDKKKDDPALMADKKM